MVAGALGRRVGVAVGVGVGEGRGVKVGVGGVVGGGGSVGLGVGARVGVAVGIWVGLVVGIGVDVGSAGVSCTNIGSDDTGLGVSESVGIDATSTGFAAKTFATMSNAIIVSPATMPPSSQSRRGGVGGRRLRPPWTTPL